MTDTSTQKDQNQPKRDRSSNFTNNERTLLLRLANLKKNVIENHRTDGQSNTAKEQEWKNIERSFNAENSLSYDWLRNNTKPVQIADLCNNCKRNEAVSRNMTAELSEVPRFGRVGRVCQICFQERKTKTKVKELPVYQ